MKTCDDIDFDGQWRAERIMLFIMTSFAVAGFAWGYAVQRFSETLCIAAVGALVALVVTVPPWPIYRRRPLKWQKPRGQEDSSKKISTIGENISHR